MTIPKVVFNLISQMTGIDHNLGNAMTLQQLDEKLHDWLTHHRNHRLRNKIGYRAYPRTFPGCQNHRFHGLLLHQRLKAMPPRHDTDFINFLYGNMISAPTKVGMNTFELQKHRFRKTSE